MSLKIWERHFLLELSKTFFLFIACFYGLYVLIDYSSHASAFHSHVHFQWRETIFYYLSEFSRRLEILMPFALLIATVRTLCNLNIHNEFVALMSGGISLKRLMLPFVWIGLFCTLIVYLNTEMVLPKALNKLKRIDDSRTREKHKNLHHTAAQNLVLNDHSTLIFQSYDSAQNLFYDAYWVRNIDDIYRIKYLYPNLATTGIPTGSFVEHLTRNSDNELVKSDAYDSLPLPDMQFNKELLFETITPADEQSISTLWQKLPSQQDEMSEKESQTLAAFYIKLALPWLCLLAVIAPAPFCLRSTRQLPVFFIYAGSIFGLVLCYILLGAALLLGRRQVLPSFWAIWIPFSIFSGFFTYRFFRKL